MWNLLVAFSHLNWVFLSSWHDRWLSTRPGCAGYYKPSGGLIFIFSSGWPPLTALRQEQRAPPPCRRVGLEVQVPSSISLDTGKGDRAAPCSGSLFAPRWLGGAGVPCYCSPVRLCWHWWGRRLTSLLPGSCPVMIEPNREAGGHLLTAGGAGSPGSPGTIAPPVWHCPVGSPEPGKIRNLSSLLPLMAMVGWSRVFSCGICWRREIIV